ncbi:septation protein SepH [Cellulomonas sp. PSBB021]|uniref:septation protein SepH n=1 Tax=Cellulomonas sp. PSBB021 TaxID=2003551 RepID=UPI000B8D52DF|nr:septation protein SepH [Cellulomonas sp. PSBB021]ASR54712.1 DNA-binding protein [Cellulomonas sp. PSBB021]
MDELELVGLHDDGEHLVLARADGQRFRVRIDEPLRAAVRRDRPQLEQLRAEGASSLSPREIQARIRAGATTQEVADASGLPVAHVRRYEGPVLAEREYVAEQARATRVGRDHGAPVLGDLVTDRLAARGVDLGSLSWDAAREPHGPWCVLARFSVDDSPREARWTFDPGARTLVADEDEARWLSETELPDEPVARRHLSAVRDVVFDFDSVGSVRHVGDGPVDDDTHEQPAVDADERTHALLDDLQARRGVRQSVAEGDDDEDDGTFEGFGPQHAFDFTRLDDVPGAHPADADPQREAVVLHPRRPSMPPVAGSHDLPAPADKADSTVAVADETAPASEPTAEPAAEPAAEERPRARKGRAKVPSWDEIVFGARPE